MADPPEDADFDALLAEMGELQEKIDAVDGWTLDNQLEIAMEALRCPPGDWPVTDLARDLGMTQPQASKHLRVLREVGLVRVRGAGKQRLYGLDARGLRPVHEWVGGFERFWSESFDRLDEYVQELKQARQEESHDGDDQ